MQIFDFFKYAKSTSILSMMDAPGVNTSFHRFWLFRIPFFQGFVNSCVFFVHRHKQVVSFNLLKIWNVSIGLFQLTLQKSMVGNVYVAEKESTSLNVLLVCILDQTFQGEHVTNAEFHCPKCQVMNTIYYLVALLIDLAVQKQVSVDPLKAEFTKTINSRRSKCNGWW